MTEQANRQDLEAHGSTQGNNARVQRRRHRRGRDDVRSLPYAGVVTAGTSLAPEWEIVCPPTIGRIEAEPAMIDAQGLSRAMSGCELNQRPGKRQQRTSQAPRSVVLITLVSKHPVVLTVPTKSPAELCVLGSAATGV